MDNNKPENALWSWK